jgi:hypothetical protein
LDQEVSEWYQWGDTYYYYKTYVTGYNWHVIWLSPWGLDDNFDLYLYGDSAYTNLVTWSKKGSGELEWIVYFYNGSLPYYYPQVYSHSGSTGGAFIEWDAYTQLQRGTNRTYPLEDYDCVEIYNLILDRSSIYTIWLDVPDDCDFDLYLYYLNSGEVANSTQYLRNSTKGLGIDEIFVNYQPPYSGTYLALVAQKAGTGNYTIGYDYYSDSSAVGLWYWGIGVGIGATLIIFSVYRRKKGAHLLAKSQAKN